MMSFELIRANLNMYVVLKNLEDLVEHDPAVREIVRDWDVSIQFDVKNGPRASVEFRKGVCEVRKGKHRRPTFKLYFFSPAHFNRMMDGNANPIPLKGFTKLGFLKKEFPKVVEKLIFYLRPTDELLADARYLERNTRLTLQTAVFAVQELSVVEPVSRMISRQLHDATAVLKVAPDGPAVNMAIKNGIIISGKGDLRKPMASLTMRNMQVANDFLNGRMDIFAGLALSDVTVMGVASVLDTISLILDRIPLYLK